jgi:hypothetical protein
MRIQILPLPSLMVGDDMEEPFALLVDQWEGTPAENAVMKEFGLACGARAVMTTPFTAEILDQHAEMGPSEIDRLAAYLVEYFDGEIGEGSAVDNAIRLLNSALLRRDAAKMKAELEFMLKSRRPDATESKPEPEPIGYTVVTVFSNGVAFIPADTENLETRDEAVARRKHLTERIPPHDGSWVACKVVPLVDGQGQG